MLFTVPCQKVAPVAGNLYFSPTEIETEDANCVVTSDVVSQSLPAALNPSKSRSLFKSNPFPYLRSCK